MDWEKARGKRDRKRHRGRTIYDFLLSGEEQFRQRDFALNGGRPGGSPLHLVKT